MKVRLGILVLGLLLGLLGKWGLSERGNQASHQAMRRHDARRPDVVAASSRQIEPVAAIDAGDPSFSDSLVPPVPLTGDVAAAPSVPAEISAGARAIFEPHGEQVCASGCAASRHPTPELTGPNLRQLLERFAIQPISENSEALETLLFYGRQTRGMLERENAVPLDPQRFAFLRQELARTHAKISIRVVDESGVVRSSLPPTRVPLDRRHVFSMDVNDVQPLVTSGTVKRVGLYHLWTRL